MYHRDAGNIGVPSKIKKYPNFNRSDLEEMHMSSAIRKLGDVCTYCTVGSIVALSVVTAAVLIWALALG